MEDEQRIKSIEIEAPTVEEAVSKGLSLLNLTREKVEIRVLSEGRKGLFGKRGAKPAKVKITYKSP